MSNPQELEYSYLLDQANTSPDPIRRLLLVAAFGISAYNSTKSRASRKPFMPLLGETYELVRKDLGFRFVAEKVVHRPHTVIAGHADSPNYIFHQENRLATKFWGKSVDIIPSGTVHVLLKQSGEHYTWTKVPSRFLFLPLIS
jgi:hypothetical protein